MIVSPLQQEKEWRETADGCSFATFFQTPYWFSAFPAHDPSWKKEVLLFSFPDGASAIFPFLNQTSRNSQFMLSGPAGVYGGWVSKSKLQPDQQRQIVDYLIARYRNLVWRLNPFAGMQPDPRWEWRPDHTTVLDLQPGFKSLSQTWSENHRRGIKKALNHGVQVRRATSILDWRQYFSCYQDSLRRWGKKAGKKYEWDFFSALAKLPGSSTSLWLAEKEHRLQAGAICFSYNRHTVYWHGAAYAESFPDRPVHLLMQEIIRDACDREGKWFDFNPSGGHEGVERFKKGFRGRPLEAPLLDTRQPALRVRIVSAVRKRLFFIPSGKK